MSLRDAKQGDWLLVDRKSLTRVARLTKTMVIDESGGRWKKRDGWSDCNLHWADLITPERAGSIQREHHHKRLVMRVMEAFGLDQITADKIDHDVAVKYAGELDRIREMLIAELEVPIEPTS